MEALLTLFGGGVLVFLICFGIAFILAVILGKLFDVL